MAAEYKLFPIYKEEFHHVFQEHQEHYKPLMVRMKVVDDNGESSMDEDQWEAASKPRPLAALFFDYIAIFFFFPPRYLYCICF